MKNALVVAVALLGSACATTSHATQKVSFGTPRSTADMLAVIDQPGPASVETVASADWQVTRAGLINLDNPKAKAAGLKDGDEPIQIFFHVIRHPTKGTFLVDTGVETALRDHPDRAAIQGIVASVMHLEKMKFNAPLGEWLAAHKDVKPDGVFFTHLHLDHVAGARDLPASTPIYVGPAEATSHAFMNMFVQGNNDRALEGKPALSELQFQPDPSGRFDGVLDLFGDGSVWALWVPGHTSGSVAFVVRTPNGPVLLTGDACHTRWGWENDVEPGTFSDDQAQSRVSLEKLRQLAAEHPKMEVRLGHQR
ncbi:MAG: MBL fold metallo-hydrolase [Deltaproteobacteria bacterium]|nr:MBL fold metallo-hydrolase [Deltaproteobacteria bacterium]